MDLTSARGFGERSATTESVAQDRCSVDDCRDRLDERRGLTDVVSAVQEMESATRDPKIPTLARLASAVFCNSRQCEDCLVPFQGPLMRCVRNQDGLLTSFWIAGILATSLGSSW